MSRTFTKLFSSITESTIWCEPDRTRLVWICMLAMADQHGRVWASVPGLANRARVPIEDAQTALDAFLSPDPYSRTPDHEGRRIEPIDGGWRLLNHEKYRSIRDEESIKESKRNYINKRRAAEREGVEKSRTPSNTVDASIANTEAEAETEAITSSLRSEEAPRKRVSRSKAVDRPDEVPESVWKDFQAIRLAKRSPLTETALSGIRREADKAGIDLASAIAFCCENGWQGFRAEWYGERTAGRNGSLSRPAGSPNHGRHSGFNKLNYSNGVNDDGTLA